MPSGREAEPVLAPLGHAARLGELVRSAARERLPHALLLTGAPGIGKHVAAHWLAGALLCGAPEPGDRPCGRCAGCRQYLSGNHLDAYAIDDDAERIPLRKIAYRPADDDAEPIEAERFLATRAAAGGWRVLVIRDADRMTDEAQNAALKMLEEPGERALWILTSARPNALLATVRSRCVELRLERLSPQDCVAVLVRAGLDEAQARAHAAWSRGSPGRALALHARSAAKLCAELLGALSGRAPPLDAARALMAVPGEFAGNTPLQEARDRARTVLDLALEIVADAARRAAGAPPEATAHADLLAELDPDVLRAQAPAFARKLAALLEARADIDKNLDPQSLLDRACLTLAP